jgi:RNA polymerase sigma-70 factor, ECF subfamily
VERNEVSQVSDNSNGLSSATSASLLVRVLADEPRAWERLLALYAPLVWHWCRKSGLQEEDWADILQEVFQSVARGLPQFRREADGSFRGWLRTITRHKICDFHRRRQHEPRGAGGSDAQRWYNQVPDPALPDEASEADITAERQLVQRALELLRPEFAQHTWQAFWRTAVAGDATADVAAQLGMTAGAVRVAKCRVLHRLREELGEQPARKSDS